jgi:hypothetical protein
MRLKTVLIEINILRSLLVDDEIHSISSDIVEALRQKIEVTRECETVLACYDGYDFWVFDGYHRLEAMKSLGFNACRVRLFQGSRRDALRRYIKDKLKSKGIGTRHVFYHCLKVLSEDPEWKIASINDLSRLFGRKPAFFEALRLYQPDRKKSNTFFSVNKHGSINLSLRHT